MSVYCMSDIHGQLGAFRELLDKISFSPADTLYIIGDVIDRGPWGIELLQQIMKMPNVTMLLGNHELMMLQFLSPNPTPRQIRRWNINRNADTLAAFRRLSPPQQEEILSFIRSLPDCLDLTVGQTRYFLVHGFPGCDTWEAVWGRPSGVQTENPLPDRHLIIGHTPVPLVLCPTDEEEDAYFQRLEQSGDHVRILHAPGFTDIDCGCGHSSPGCALACLRLDDGAEFYVPVHTAPAP